jgi:elongation factor G
VEDETIIEPNSEFGIDLLIDLQLRSNQTLLSTQTDVQITGKDDDPLLPLAFKHDETQYGHFIYKRIYRGTLKRGYDITNVNSGRKIKLARVVRMHSDAMEEIDQAGAGEVVAMFGTDHSSMDTFSDGGTDLVMSSMYIPEGPVMSFAVKLKKMTLRNQFGKAFNKFTKEDPTLRVKVDGQTQETIISGWESCIWKCTLNDCIKSVC